MPFTRFQKRSLLLASSALIALAVFQTPSHASDILVTDAASLSAAIAAAGSGDRILIQNDINLGNTLLPPVGTNITIEGNGHTISAGGNNRIFFLNSSATIQNVTLSGGVAKGGNGGDGFNSGGGGLGAGGAIFVNSGNATVSNVSFSNNRATGGNGGGFYTNGGTTGGGGGGGLGGSGGTGGQDAGGGGGGYSGGGGGGGGTTDGASVNAHAGTGGAGPGGAGGSGGFGINGQNGTNGGAGGVQNLFSGIYNTGGGGGGGGLGGGTGGNGSTSNVNGGGGGGGGGLASGSGGTGGTQPGNPNGTDGGLGGGGGGVAAGFGNTAGNGGDLGGGGGGANFNRAGDGGFGGGGGGAGQAGAGGGNGGFGGGGGGDGSDIPGTGGVGGGNAVSGSGGGGAGFGGAVFVRDGASLTITDGSFDGGSVTAGNGSSSSSNGAAAGSDLFLMTGTTTTFNPTGTLTFNGTIADDSASSLPAGQTYGAGTGTGAAIAITGGTVVFNGANTYSGGTTISGATLVVGNNNALGTGAATLDGGTLQAGGDGLNLANIIAVDPGGGTIDTQADTLTLSGAVVDGAGSGVLTKTGTGTLVLSGSGSTFNGEWELASGTLSLASSTALGSSALLQTEAGTTLDFADTVTVGNLTVLNGATVLNVSSGSATQAGQVLQTFGYSVEKTGAGTLVVDNFNASGPVTITGGTLQGGGINAFGSFFDNNSVTTVRAGATLDLGGFDQVIGTLAGDAGSFVTNSGSGDAILTVGGNSVTTTNTIFAGVISDGATNKTGLTVDSFTTANGPFILTGANTYTGATLICDCGALQLGNGGSTGSIVSDVINNGVLIFDRSDVYTFSNTISQGLGSPGRVEQIGSGTLILSGTNTYAGGTTVTGGILAVSSDDNLGDPNGGLALNGGTLRAEAGFALNANRTVTLGALGGTLDVNGNGIEVDGDIHGAGHLTIMGGGFTAAGGITSLGGFSSVAAIFGVNDYVGGTTISDTVVVAIDSTALGAATSDLTLQNNGTILFFDPTLLENTRTITLGTGGGILAALDLQVDSKITGSGGLTLLSADLITLTGANDYTGGTVLLGSGGSAVEISADDNLGAAGGSLTMNEAVLIIDADITMASRAVALDGLGGVFDTNGHTLTIMQAVSGTGDLVQTDTGTLILAADNTHTGDTYIDGGTLQLGIGGASGSLAAAPGDILYDGGTLVLNSSGTHTISQNIVDFLGSGVLQQVGSGTTILTGTNSYSGGTVITAGLINFASLSNLGTGNVTLDGGGLQWAVGNTVDVSAQLNALGAGGGTLDTNGNDVTLASVISGLGGLTKIGTGTLTLTGANAYQGGTTISAGTLAVSGSGALGTGAVTNNSVLRAVATATLPNAIILNVGSDSTISAAAGTTFNLNGNWAFNTSAADGHKIYIGSATDTGIVNVSAPSVTVGANAGPLEIVGGTLKDTSATAPQSSFTTALGLLSSVTIDSGATLEIDSNGNGRAANTETFIKLFGSGQLVMGGAYIPRVVLGTSNFAGHISGAGYIGIGGNALGAQPSTVILTGNDNAAVEFQIGPDSTLQIGDGGTTGSLSNGSHVVGYSDPFLGQYAILKFDRSDNVTLGSGLFGSLVLQQAGSGILTISGDNSAFPSGYFYGSVVVSSGGISISSDNNLVGAPIALSNATTLYTTATGTYTSAVAVTGAATFNAASGTTAIWSGLIANGTGTGSLQVAGGGRLILTANDTYTGGTTVSAGTLQIGNGGADGLVVGDISNNGALVFDRSGSFGLTGMVSGAGSLTMAGTGTLILTGANNYTGATTIIAGTLQLGGGGAAGSILGNVTDNGTLAFNRSDNVIFDKVISGSGGLTTLGAGDLILTAANTYTGGTIISAGALQVGNGGTNGSITGIIQDFGALAFNRSDALTYGDVISGTGALTKLGGGNLILAAANTYTGATTVAGGTLSVNGSIASSAVTVAAGGTLGGNGTVGSTIVQSGGALAAGNSVGTLTVNGDLTLAQGSTLVAEVDQTAADRVNVTGNTSLAGNLLATFATGSGYVFNTPYTLLNSTGTLSGTFANFDTLNIPTGYVAVVNYDAHNVIMDLLPAVYQWGATPGTSDWNTGTNWLYGLVPGAGDVAVFDATNNPTVTINAAANAKSLQFNAGVAAYSLNITGTATSTASLTLANGGLIDSAANAPTIMVSGVAGHTGTLAFTGMGTAADATITAANFGTVSFAGTTDAGAGARLTAAGGGTVSFAATTGVNADNRIAAGSIAGAGNFILGANILTVGALNSSTEVSGVISGTGGLTKVGSGTLLLSGANTYTGATRIDAGVLSVNGSLASNVTVAGGALKGHGFVNGVTINNGAALAPGNSIGTLSVGTLTFASGSSYQVETDATGASDLVNATGLVTVTGATVQALPAAGNYAASTTYRIINAGSISGTFAGVTSSAGNLAASLIYGATSVDLRLMRTDFQFGTSYGVTSNQVAAGSAVSAGGAGSGLYGALANVPSNAGAAALDSLSGEIQASLRSALLEDGAVIRATLLDRLQQPGEGISVWVRGVDASGDIAADGNAARTGHNNAGFVAGIDLPLGDTFRGGVGGGYTSHSVSLNDRASNASGDSGHVFAYAGGGIGDFALRAGGTYDFGNSDIQRRVAFLSETDSSNRDHQGTQLFADLGYPMAMWSGTLEPYAGVAFAQIDSGAFRETGGALSSLSGVASATASLYTSLGARLRLADIDLGDGVQMAPHIDIAWRHGYGALQPAQALTFNATGQGFTVLGASAGTEAADIDLGVAIKLAPGLSLGVGYNGAFSSSAQNHAATLSLSRNF